MFRQEQANKLIAGGANVSARNDRNEFIRALWKLMLPIVVQNLISAVVSTADVLMLSSVSEGALSASSLAGQVTFTLTLFYSGLSAGASILAAQYWGGETERPSKKSRASRCAIPA